MTSVALLNKISKTGMVLLAFLMPLWFLPFTQDAISFQKQALLVALTVLSVVSWFAKVVSQGEVKIHASGISLLVLVVFFAGALSTIFSLWHYGSFWGWPFNTADSFLTLAVFALFSLLCTNALEGAKELFQVFAAFIAGVALAGLFAVLQLYQIFLVPFSFAKVATFNTIGSITSVAVLASALLPLAQALAFASKTLLRWIFWIISFALFAVVVLVNSSYAWFVLLSGLLALLAFGMWNMKKRAEFGWVSFPMVLLLVALLFLTFRISLPGAPFVPPEVSPSRSAELAIFQKMFPQNALFGTGPGTFVFDYAKYHEPVLNKTIFWGTRFASGASEILDWFITKGLFGGLSLVLLFALAIFLAFKKLATTAGDQFSWMLGLGMTASFVGLVVSQIVYTSNLTIAFALWLLIGGLGMYVAKREYKISLAPPSFAAVWSSFIFLLTLIFGIGLLFLGGRNYAAEMEYLRGAGLLAGGELKKGIAHIETAASLNPSLDLYWRDLAQLYLNLPLDPKLSDADKQKQQQAIINSATLAANQIVLINPANVENWNVRGFVFRNLIGIQGADSLAFESYKKVTALEPASPFGFMELGRAYLSQAQSLAGQKDAESRRQDAFKHALDNLNQAIALKKDYAPAQYLLAVLSFAQGKSDEAIAKLEETKTIAPNDVGLAFQLGVLYYQKGSLEKAQAEFERARNLDEKYANARFMLGLVYDKQHQRDKAMAEFTKVAVLNPENTQVKQILANLNAGKPALSSIQPSQPPLQENPPEIQKKK